MGVRVSHSEFNEQFAKYRSEPKWNERKKIKLIIKRERATILPNVHCPVNKNMKKKNRKLQNKRDAELEKKVSTNRPHILTNMYIIWHLILVSRTHINGTTCDHNDAAATASPNGAGQPTNQLTDTPWKRKSIYPWTWTFILSQFAICPYIFNIVSSFTTIPFYSIFPCACEIDGDEWLHSENNWLSFSL